MHLSWDQSTLTIRTSKLSDSGVYYCIGENVAGDKRKEFKINILSPPKILLDNNIENHQHNIGEQTILKCPLQGNPPPKIFWTKQKSYNNFDEDEILSENSTELVSWN